MIIIAYTTCLLNHLGHQMCRIIMGMQSMSSLLYRPLTTLDVHGHIDHVLFTIQGKITHYHKHTQHVFFTIQGIKYSQSSWAYTACLHYQAIKYTSLSWAYRSCLHYYPGYQIHNIMMGIQSMSSLLSKASNKYYYHGQTEQCLLYYLGYQMHDYHGHTECLP